MRNYKKKPKRERLTLKEDIEVKISPVKTCANDGCVRRFIEISIEQEMGYKREVCPWCEPYLHWEEGPHTILHSY